MFNLNFTIYQIEKRDYQPEFQAEQSRFYYALMTTN